jgi:hypothetical protein
MCHYAEYYDLCIVMLNVITLSVIMLSVVMLNVVAPTYDPVAGSLNKRLMLSSSFRCDQIYKYETYNFGHTLLCYLSPT